MKNLRLEAIKDLQKLQKCLLDWRLQKVKKNLQLGEAKKLQKLTNEKCDCGFDKWIKDVGSIFLDEETAKELVSLRNRMINIEKKIEKFNTSNDNSDNWISRLIGDNLTKIFQGENQDRDKMIFLYHKNLRNVSEQIIKILKNLELKWLEYSDEEFMEHLQ